jgi:hypothetical protein
VPYTYAQLMRTDAAFPSLPQYMEAMRVWYAPPFCTSQHWGALLALMLQAAACLRARMLYTRALLLLGDTPACQASTLATP